MHILKCLIGGRQHAGTVYTLVNKTHSLPSMYLQFNDVENKPGVKYFVICDKIRLNAQTQELIRGTTNPI